MCTVLDLIQKKIQNYEKSVKMADKSQSFQFIGEQLMNQISFGINQMALCIQPILEEMKFFSLDSTPPTFRSQNSKRSQSVGEKKNENISKGNEGLSKVNENISNGNESVPKGNDVGQQQLISKHLNKINIEIKNQIPFQMDLKNVQTASFGEQIPSQKLKESKDEIQNESPYLQINQCPKEKEAAQIKQNEQNKYQLVNKDNQEQQQQSMLQGKSIEYKIPKSETSLEIESIKRQILQRQQRRKQNEQYQSNHSFSYNSNQSNSYFTIGRDQQSNSFSAQNHSFSCDNQNQS